MDDVDLSKLSDEEVIKRYNDLIAEELNCQNESMDLKDHRKVVDKYEPLLVACEEEMDNRGIGFIE